MKLLQTEVLIALIGAAAAVLGALISAGVSLKNRKNAIDEAFKKEVTAALAELTTIKDTQELQSAHLLENYLELMRHKIYSVTLPLEEKVNAGQKYLDHGGNGSAKIQHERNVEELRGAGLK